MAEIQDSVVMVTGGSGNVGRGVVEAFAAVGAKVAIVDLRKRDCDEVAEALGGDPARYQGFGADLSQPEAVDALIAEVTAAFGRIDHLVHTVGGFAMGDPVHAGNLDVFDKMMALNVRVLYLVAGRVARAMIDTGVTGSISLILARAAQAGGKNKAAYTASKAAAARIMESMAAELKEHQIRVNGISPSTVDTPPNRDDMPNANFDNWVTPAQIGELAVELARNDAMTGADVAISRWS